MSEHNAFRARRRTAGEDDLAGIERLNAAIARETGRLGRAQIIEEKLARATLARHHEAFGQIPVRLDGAVQIAIRLLHHRERDAAPPSAYSHSSRRYCSFIGTVTAPIFAKPKRQIMNSGHVLI